MAFLNESGLARLWENIIAKLNNKIETEVKVLDDKIKYVDSKAVQSDWSQNDTSAPDYIKNRAFYEGIFPLFEGDLVVGKYGAAHFDSSLPVELGQEYTVVVDGMSMTGTACYTETEYTIGDGYYDESGNHIFSVDNYGIYFNNNYYPEGAVAHVTVSTYGIKQIDEKFVEWAMHREDPVGTGSFSMNRKENTTIGYCSHAEGYYTTASGRYSHAEGSGTEASDYSSHAEGTDTKASGYSSHAEGMLAEASGHSSHAEGDSTIATGASQHVQGKYNIVDASSKYAHIVGNGTSDTNRSNIHTLDWEGNAWYSGDVYVGSTSGTNRDEGSKKLATEEYVTSKIESMEVTPEDIIEWMTEEGAIVPLASTSGQVYATNDNKILII